MERSVLPTEISPPDGPSSKPSDEGGRGTSASWLHRHNVALTMVAAGVTPVLYLLYIAHFAVNDFQFDDWSVIPLVHAAIHGHLSLGQLWAQHTESRVLVANVLFVLFGLLDRFDTRWVIVFNALVYIATYALVLTLFRRYMGRRLTPIPVLVIGLVWFSLADVQASLWAFQLTWYLVVFFFVVVLCALLVPTGHRTLWLTVALLAGLAASLSFLQGFIVWPLGAVCILWSQPWARRAFVELAVWIGGILATSALYFSSYHYNSNCDRVIQCSTSSSLGHPLTALRYFSVLIGDVVPGGYWSALFSPVHNFDRFEVVGAVLFATAIFIVVQSWRHRTSSERIPVPMLLISFALLFDAMITLGRSRMGSGEALFSNRYVMANLMLLTGIVMYAWRHRPPRILPIGARSWKVCATWLTLLTLAIFLVVQTTVATGFGLNNGQLDREFLTNQARLVVNLDRIPPQDRSCEVNIYLDLGTVNSKQPSAQRIRKIDEAATDQLGEFRPDSFRYFRKLGPPPLSPICSTGP